MEAISGLAVLPVETCVAAPFRIECVPKSAGDMGCELVAVLRAADDVPEYPVEPLVLRATLEELGLPIQDERVRHDVAGKGEVSTDLGIFGARVHVPGVINVFYALLVRLCDAHVEKEGVLCKGHEVDLGVDNVLRP